MAKKYSIALGISEDQEGNPFISISSDLVPIELILNIAKEAGIPVIKNPELARQLSSFDVDDTVPAEFLEAVEKTLTYLKEGK
ncbi:MAG: EscU/YscU/HrcU family type III secretion system export apparatus switch protein [Deltaproteobacteria bacterium]|nr:EscU/YscU/HrcU family type III secretion system export apparatus switch protein [Deltaproteobacteria bacterium]